MSFDGSTEFDTSPPRLIGQELLAMCCEKRAAIIDEKYGIIKERKNNSNDTEI